MKTSPGTIAAWDAVAAVVSEEDPVESEFLPDFVESSIGGVKKVGNQPGGFDLNALGLTTTTLYAVAATAIASIAPKLFDAALDVSKDFIKKRFDPQNVKKKSEQPTSATTSLSLNISEVREVVRQAGIKQRLSEATIERLTTAIISSIAEARAER